jgi:hypothetical protein
LYVRNVNLPCSDAANGKSKTHRAAKPAAIKKSFADPRGEQHDSRSSEKKSGGRQEKGTELFRARPPGLVKSNQNESDAYERERKFCKQQVRKENCPNVQ